MAESKTSPILNRRKFLEGSASVAAGAALGLRFLLETTAEAASDSAWNELARRLLGPVLRPGSDEFWALAAPFNRVTASIVPEGIARCGSAKDVSNAIGWALKYGVPLITRSGGHSAGGYSVTRGLMVDTKLMNQAQFDSDTGIATIGGGTLNAGVYQVLKKVSRTITHGRCPQVGAAGFLLGGGVGFNIRALGVGIDALVGSQIVLADGDILTLSDTQNSDLFWACRGGGGGNFGINTSFSVQTYPAPPSVTSARVAWNTDVESVFPVLMDALYASPTSLGTWTTLSAVTPRQFASGKDASVYFEGQLFGPPAEMKRIIAPVLALAQPASMKFKEMDYWCTQETIWSDTPSPSDLQNCTIYFQGPISPAACAIVLKWLRQWPGTSKYANLSFLRTGGQANETPGDATAFVHRDNDWLAVFYLKWNANKDSAESINENLVWLNEFYSELAQFGVGEAYQNFLDPSLTDFLQQYYGSNLSKLQQIKNAVDPMGVFQFPQGIPASSSSDPSDLHDTSDVVVNDPTNRWPTMMRHAAGHKQSLAAGRDAVHRAETSRNFSARGNQPSGAHKGTAPTKSVSSKPSVRQQGANAGGSGKGPDRGKHRNR